MSKGPRGFRLRVSFSVVVLLVGLAAIALPTGAFVLLKRHDYAAVTRHGIATGNLSRWAAWSIELKGDRFQLGSEPPGVFVRQRIRVYQDTVGLVDDTGWRFHSELNVSKNAILDETPPIELPEAPPERAQGIIDGRVVYKATPIKSWDGRTGVAVAYSDKLELLAEMGRVKQRVYGFVGGALLLLGGLVVAFHCFYTRPLRRLAYGIESRTIGSESFRVSEGRPDEIGSLARAYARERQRHEAFTADILHELKNPISILRLGLTELRDRESEEGGKLAFDRLLRENARMESLLFSIRELGNYESQRSSETCDARLVIENLIRLYPESRLRLVAEKTLPESLLIAAAPDDFGRVLRNLIDNALDFSAEETEVTLRCEVDGEFFLLEVEDRGQGISEQDLPKVFDRFYSCRGDEPATELHHGLGLAIAKTIVESAGGVISCQSQVGVGTRFLLRIPLLT